MARPPPAISVDEFRGRWSFSLEVELEMAEDPVNGLRLFDKRDDSHLASRYRTKQRVNLIYFSDHLGPASGREMILPFNDQEDGRARFRPGGASPSLRQSFLYFLCLFLLKCKGFFIKSMEKATELVAAKFNWTVPNRTPSVTVENTFLNYQIFMTNGCCSFISA